MADDLQLSLAIGTGSTLATDQGSGGEHYQQVKLIDGTADSTTEVQTGAGTAANALRVELPTDGTGKVGLNTGTNSVGTVGLNTGTNSVGTVGIDAGTNLMGLVKASGNVAHDAAYSENPVPIGAIAYETDGTAPGTAVAELDITRLKADRDGRMLVNTGHPFAWSVSADYASAQTNVTVKAAAGASLSLYLTGILISNGAVAGNVTLLDGSGGTVRFEAYLPINGHVLWSPPNPIRLTANTLLAFTSTSSTTHAVNISGYTAA